MSYDRLSIFETVSLTQSYVLDINFQSSLFDLSKNAILQRFVIQA